MFLSPALCPRSYLTLSHSYESLENSWDALHCTLIFHERTCMCLSAQRKHFRTSNSPYTVCTILSACWTVTSKKIILCKPWKPASVQFQMGSIVHMWLWPNFDHYLVMRKGMERFGPGTHLRLCVCYLEAFTSANAFMEHFAVSSTKKPWRLTGKLLAKWALPGHGTNCCPHRFKSLKVRQYSEANWLDVRFICLLKNHHMMAVWAFCWNHQTSVLEMRCLENTKAFVKQCPLTVDLSGTRECTFAEIQAQAVYPTDDRPTGRNPRILCPDARSPH